MINDLVKKLSIKKACSPEFHAELQNTYWKLLELDGNSTKSPAGSREMHLILDAAESRAHGFAGGQILSLYADDHLLARFESVHF